MIAPDTLVYDWPLVHGFETRFITASDGTRLRLVQAGSPGAPPVVLVHGAPQHAYEWRHVIPLLASRFRVTALDLRGYGASDLATTDRYDMDILVDDLRRVVDAALTEAGSEAGSEASSDAGSKSAKGGVRLVAHDWGGPIAFVLAERFPHLVKHYIAANAPHPGAFVRELRHARQLVRSWYIIAFQIPGIEALFERNDAELGVAMLRGSSPPGLFTEADIAMYRAALARPGRARAAIAYYKQAFGGPNRGQRIREALKSPKIRVPVTILWGDADRAIAPTHPEATRPYVEHLEVHRLIGVSHWVPEERPREVAAAVPL